MADENAVGSVVSSVSCDAAHGFSKPVKPRIRLIAGFGVEGDAHMGRTVKHRYDAAQNPTRPNLRQVHLIHEELFDELSRSGFSVVPGQLGENVTTRGIDLLSLPVGTLISLGGEAVIEVTGLRGPCAQINGLQPGLLKAVLERKKDGTLVRKAGIMAIVRTSGEVKSDDPIRITLPAEPHKRLEPV